MRRSLAAAVAVSMMVAGLVGWGAPSVEAAPTAVWVDGDVAEGRLLYDVSDDGRYVLTATASFNNGSPMRVVDTVTGATTTLARSLGPSVFLSGDGRRVLFSTGLALVPEDTDIQADVYSMSLTDPSDVWWISPGWAQYDLVPLDTNGDGSVAVMQASSVALFSTRFVMGGAGGLVEIPSLLAPEPTVRGMSSDGNLAFVSTGCSSDPACVPHVLFRFDRRTSTSTPVSVDGSGVPIGVAAAANTPDGSCVAYVERTNKRVMRRCGAGEPSVVSAVPAVAGDRFRCSMVAITADGATVSWLGWETLRLPSGSTFSVPGVYRQPPTGPLEELTRGEDGNATAALDCLVASARGLVVASSSDQLSSGGGQGVQRIHLLAEDTSPVPTTTAPTTTAPTTTAPTTTAPTTTAPTVGSAGPVPGAGVFTGRTPVRILDTRIGLGASPGRPSGGSSIVIPVRGRNGVPPDATAVAVQLTATEGAAVGYVSLLPTGSVVGRSSNLNLDMAGETIANSAIVPIGSDGSITVYTHGTTHLIVDLAGWWTPATQATAAGRFRPVGPARVLDTRADSTIGHTGGKPAAGSTTVVQVTGRLGVPTTGVAAVVLNVTIAEPESLGFVQVSPAASLQPGASSTLNVGRAGQVMAVSTIVPVDAAGRIALYAQPSTHLVVDVAGWFTDASAAPGLDGMFVPAPDVDPRQLDTRPFSPTWKGAKPVAGQRIDLPASGGAMVGNVTVVDTDGPGFVQLGPARSMVDGATSNINPTTRGEVVANAFIVPVDVGGLGIYTSNGTHLLVDVVGTMTA